MLEAHAERSPTDVELKSVYCITVLTASMEIEKMLGGSSFARNASNLNRLQSYLLPRVRDVDVEALLLAKNRAQKDRELYSTCAPKCAVLSNFRSCLGTCSEELGGPLARLLACNNVNFLPF